MIFANLLLKDIKRLGEFKSVNLRKIAEEAAQYNIRKLILAPAYYGEESKTSIQEVKTVVEELNSYLKVKEIDLTIYPANLIKDNYDNVKEYINGNLGSINNSHYILLDIEESNNVDDLLEIIFEYKLRNMRPIIVGPERMEEIINNNKNIDKLLNENCLFQLDAASLKGKYGKKIKKTAKKLMKKDIYQFVGFEESIEKNYTVDEMESLGKQGLFILNPEGAMARRIMKNSKKRKFRFFK